MLGDENRSEELGRTMDMKHAALVVIDELGDPEQTPLVDTLLPPTLKTAQLVEAAHKTGMPVIFTNDAHLPGIDHELELWGAHGIAGSPEAQISPQIPVGKNDFIIEKRRYSAFFQTGLRLLLDELGVKAIICCGMDTNICVRHTVADAYFNNIATVVVGDATATFLVGEQAEGLDYMKTCYATKIIDTQEALTLIAGEEAA